MMKGAFCDLSKHGGDGWGVAIEEDGDVYPGMEVEVTKKNGDTKVMTIINVVKTTDYKIICTAKGDPNDKPEGARIGKFLDVPPQGKLVDDQGLEAYGGMYGRPWHDTRASQAEDLRLSYGAPRQGKVISAAAWDAGERP